MKSYFNIIFSLFLLFSLYSCGCKDKFNPIREEEKKWIPYKDGEKIQFLVNNKDTVEYSVEVITSRENMSPTSYGSTKNCSDEIERMIVNIRNPSADFSYFPYSIDYFEHQIFSNLSSKTSCTLYFGATISSLEPDSNMIIHGISYPVYNFLYNNNQYYPYLQKVTFSKDLGYLYVRDTAGNFITYLNKIP